MRMFSGRNMDVISTGPVVNLVMKNLVLEASLCMIYDLSYGLPPFGRVPGFRLEIAD